MKNKYRYLRYTPVFLLIFTGIITIWMGGIWVWSLPVIAFGIIPILEIFTSNSEENFSKAEEALAKEDRVYDWMLYALVPIQYMTLGMYLYLVNQERTWWELAGRTAAVGISCAVLGINLAHELGHRKKKYEQNLSKALLLTSLYMHFFIEHNRGHHKRVSTDEDPASPRLGEPLYSFWVRSVVFGYLSAWRLEINRLRKKGLPAFSLKNEMLQFQLIQLAAIALVFTIGGWKAGVGFLVVATLGFLMLETVNYIEHYGLRRNEIKPGIYERVLPHHSWNSNHLLGRVLLFELTRHSDHHYLAARPYQVLRHMDGAPQMPTGYPGMMVLSLFPPLWFFVMHRHINRYKEERQAELAVA